MNGNFHIVVEGAEDLLFLKGYLNFLKMPFSDECFHDLKGWNNLGGYTPDIKQKQDQGVKVIITFDANTNRRARMKEIKRVLGGISLPVFLFPDGKSGGDLEDLLVKIIAPENGDIFMCFEDYKKCLKKHNQRRFLPDTKGKMYAYKEATGALREAKKENQFDSKYWNFDHPALNPLKKFLTDNIG